MRFNASRVKSRLAPARARRPHREAGNADDAVLLAQRVQHLARFFRQANDPLINPPWCVATARPSLAVRSPARDAIQDISRKLRLTFGEADDAARTRHGFSNR